MGNVILEESTHTYKNLLIPEFTYISVTRLLHLYEQPFDADFHSKRVAEREGVSQQEILDRWKEINRIAVEYGKKVHAIMERYLLNKQKLYIARDDFERTVLEEFQKIKMLTDHHIVKPEYVLSHPLTNIFGIAGCTDVIEDVDDYKFNMWDFKTNRELTFETQYDEWLKFPLTHLSQTKYNVDCLQISLYAYFYELESGKKVNTLGIIYWDRGEDITSATGVWKVLYLPYLKTDVKMLINHYQSHYVNILEPAV
jgi:hypothetical protein